jgi:hypothetical protein
VKFDPNIKRRKCPTKFVTLSDALDEYNLDLSVVREMLEDDILKAFGLFNNDFSMITNRDECKEQDISPETWQGRYDWEFNENRLELINQTDLQSYTKIRFLRQHLEEVLNHSISEKRLMTRFYNWEIIALQISAYMHKKDLPSSKEKWFNEVLDTIPYFKTGHRPDYDTMNKYLGIVWDALNSREVKWNQYLR